MAKRRKKKKANEIARAKKDKAQAKQALLWAVGITILFLILSYVYFRSTF